MAALKKHKIAGRVWSLATLVSLAQSYGVAWKEPALLGDIVDEMWERNVRILPQTLLDNKHVPEPVKKSAMSLLKEIELVGGASELDSFMESMGAVVINKLIILADSLDKLGLQKDANSLDQLIVKATRGEDFEDLMSLFDAPIELEDNSEKVPGEAKVLLEEPEIHTPLDEVEAPLSKEKAAPNRLDALKRRHELLQLKKKLEEAEEAAPVEEPLGEAIAPPVIPDSPKMDLKDFEDEDDELDQINNALDLGPMSEEEKMINVEHKGNKALELASAIKDLIESIKVNEHSFDPMSEDEVDRLSLAVREKIDDAVLEQFLTADEGAELASKLDEFLSENDDENSADDGNLIDFLKEKLKSAPDLMKQLLGLIKDNPELLEAFLL